MLNTNFQAFTLAVSTLLKQPSHLLPNLTISTFLDFPDQIADHLTTTTTSSSSSTSSSSNEKTDKNNSSDRKIKIKALVLDKDNTLCPPNTTSIPSSYLSKLEHLRLSPSSPFNLTTNPYGVLIVSNTAGSRPGYARYEAEARELEAKLAYLRIPVFRVRDTPVTPPHPHPPPPPTTTTTTTPVGTTPTIASGEGRGRGRGRRKPFCGPDILAYFHSKGVTDRADEVVVVGDRLGTDTLMAAQIGSWSVWCKDGVTHSASNDQGGMDYRGFLAKVETVLERYLRESRGIKPRVP